MLYNMKKKHQTKIFMKQVLIFMEHMFFSNRKKELYPNTSLDNILRYFFLSC